MAYLSRFLEKELLNWYKSNKRKPLILRGARQVGKSTLVREFALKNKLLLCEINLERHLYLDKIFESLNIEIILKELEALTGADINNPDALIFLDEIQTTPHALQALRYFYEDRPEIPVVSAGSLLEFTLADHNFSMPVGRVEYLHLGPMTFKEFLTAVSPDLPGYIGDIKPESALPETAHKKILEKQREYLFVGGMPEAVSVFTETNSLAMTGKVHSSIVDTYLDDFSKYAKQRELLLLQKVFRAIPRMAGKKIKYSNISRDDRAKDVMNAIGLLTKARICTPVVHSHCTGVPLNSDIDESAFKLIFMDIGLANHICGADWLAISNLDERGLINEGPLAEQFIGQQLINSGFSSDPLQLNYWIREGKIGNAEVDYVISRGTNIIPVEVKSGKSGSLKSVQQFMLQKGTELAVRFDLNQPSLQTVSHTLKSSDGNKNVKFNLLSLPLYAVEELGRIIDDIRT